MNGKKYGDNYAPKAHGFNLRSRFFPIRYYAPKRPLRLNEVMWDNLINRLRGLRVGGSPDELWSVTTGLVRKIDYGKTLGWWAKNNTEAKP